MDDHENQFNKCFTAVHNNLATARTVSSPYKFSSAKSQNPEVFLQDLREFTTAMEYSESQTKIAFKLSLEGEALSWLRSLPVEMNVKELESLFRERFVPSNNAVVCITELAEAVRSEEESILAFLDRLRGIASRGKLPEDVLLAMTLKALPREMANRLVMYPEGLSWINLYKLYGYGGYKEKVQC